MDLLSRIGPTTPITDLPVLVFAADRGFLKTAAGCDGYRPSDLETRLGTSQVLLCNRAIAEQRLGRRVACLDILELFAFVRPAEFAVPTPAGLAAALGLPAPAPEASAQADAIAAIVDRLLGELSSPDYPYADQALALADFMAAGNWSWSGHLLKVLGRRSDQRHGRPVWAALPEWSDAGPPREPPGADPVGENEALVRLAQVLGKDAEPRPSQQEYCAAACDVFRPRERRGMPRLALLQAGTGIGKTLGYAVPASIWAARNRGTVWLSTFTRNLQRQVAQELGRIYPAPSGHKEAAVVRKGRENYACLLNVEVEAQTTAGGNGGHRIFVGLALRWLRYTRDGDMVGGDFPRWLAPLFGAAPILRLTDRRGECIYSACPHYRRCFLEKAARRSRSAEIVIANHALVMAQAVNRRFDSDAPRRIVFDEGHHLFDAADSAFSLNLTGREAAELYRWLIGRDVGRRGRSRGLKARVDDLLGDDEIGWRTLEETVQAAGCLPRSGWLKRVQQAAPSGAVERFLVHVRAQVMARSADTHGPHSLECTLAEPVAGLVDAADSLAERIEELGTPMAALASRLLGLLDEQADSLDSASRARLDSTARSILQRVDFLSGWRAVLEAVGHTTPTKFVDWFQVDRIEGRELDVGLHRHWIDPTEPLAETVMTPAHGVLVTSATLGDRAVAEDSEDFTLAEVRTGAAHLPEPGKRASFASPFDYAAQTRILVVTDVDKRASDQVAAAYRTLIEASGGGALGLFTAIARLRAVHARILQPLQTQGLPLYAQHVDAMDTGTLVDIFRFEENASLLGTDAVRDGVDVPGRSLRLMVFDRVPWPRPTILHRARKASFGGRGYDELLARMRLSQAYGRLIRRQADRGIFVILDAQTPSRLLSAFPEKVGVERVGLAEAVQTVACFQNQDR